MVSALHLKGKSGWGITHIQVELEDGTLSPVFGNDNAATNREATISNLNQEI